MELNSCDLLDCEGSRGERDEGEDFFAVERLMVFEHAEDGVEEFAHDRDQSLHFGFAAGQEVLVEGAEMRLVDDSDQGGHVKSVAGGTSSITARYSDYVYTGLSCTTSSAAHQDSGAVNVYDFTFNYFPGIIAVNCDGQSHTLDYVETPSNGQSACSGSSCSAKLTGAPGTGAINTEITNLNFSIDAAGIGHCQFNYFAGPPDANGNVATLTVTATIAFCGTSVSRTKSVSDTMGCSQ